MKQLTVNYHILPETVTVSYGGKLRTLHRDSELGGEVIQMIRDGKIADLPEHLDFEIRLNNADPDKDFEVIDGEVYAHGRLLPKTLNDKIIQFMDEDLPFEIFLAFWDRLRKNPSVDSKKQLYSFLEANHFPLTDDGCFIGYKSVRSNYADHHTGKFDNTPGQKVSMLRKDVDANPGSSCSNGLHIASYDFARGFGGHDSIVLEVKVDPADVVSVPSDYSASKCRVCDYDVIGVVEEEYKETIAPKSEVGDGPTGGTMKIGRTLYNILVVTKDKFLDTIKDYRRVYLCDAAQIFQNRKSDEVYRKKLDSGNFSYFEKKDNNYIQLEKAAN